MELDVEKVVSGIVVELAKFGMEKFNDWLKNRNDPKKSKKRKSRRKKS